MSAASVYPIVTAMLASCRGTRRKFMFPRKGNLAELECMGPGCARPRKAGARALEP